MIDVAGSVVTVILLGMGIVVVVVVDVELVEVEVVEVVEVVVVVEEFEDSMIRRNPRSSSLPTGL